MTLAPQYKNVDSINKRRFVKKLNLLYRGAKNDSGAMQPIGYDGCMPAREAAAAAGQLFRAGPKNPFSVPVDELLRAKDDLLSVGGQSFNSIFADRIKVAIVAS